MSRQAVFLDKDGTLIQDVPYNVDPSLVRLLPGVTEGLRQLHQAGYLLIVVTNQSGVARGCFGEHSLGAVAQRLRELLAPAGVPLADFYYCPHHPEGKVAEYAVECACRKPQPGLITRAVQEHGIDPARSWLIGDILNDVEAGNLAGCRTILLDNGGETEWFLSHRRMPDHVANDLRQAAAIVSAVDAGRMPDAASTFRLLQQRVLTAGTPIGTGSWSSPRLKEKAHEQRVTQAG
jgi:D-glycero-D-manno-heptose 1,7-bisphosphate phosphatase